MKNAAKEQLKKEISDCLRSQTEIERIVVFGSFLNSPEPNDIDIAIFEDSNESYLDLSMKYRRLTRNIARKIPLDIIPIKSAAQSHSFLSEIESGEPIYER
jgi:predicted nucleotidyltransferase